MANPRKRRKSSAAGHTRRRRRNPFTLHRRRRTTVRRHHSRRRNPIRRRSYSRRRNPAGREMLMTVLGVAAGAYGSTVLPSMFMPSLGGGYLGLALDAAVAYFGGNLLGKHVNRDIGDGFTLGGLGAVALRLFNQVSGGTITPALGDYLPGASFTTPSYPTRALTPGNNSAGQSLVVGKGIADIAG